MLGRLSPSSYIYRTSPYLPQHAYTTLSLASLGGFRFSKVTWFQHVQRLLSFLPSVGQLQDSRLEEMHTQRWVVHIALLLASCTHASIGLKSAAAYVRGLLTWSGQSAGRQSYRRRSVSSDFPIPYIFRDAASHLDQPMSSMPSIKIPKSQTVALVRHLGGPIEFVEDYPVTTPGQHEVLAKVLYTGVCQSGTVSLHVAYEDDCSLTVHRSPHARRQCSGS